MKMKMTLQWLLLLRVFAFFFFLLAGSLQALSDIADSPADSIRIDCGAREDYIDPKTKSSYQSDYHRFVEYGEAHTVSSNYTKEQIENQLNTLTSFPKGKRNCYTLPITPSNENAYYLVRAFFAYGNYDNKSRTPSFDLYIGVNYWATINETDGDIVRFEVIHVSPTDEINVCLVNTGHGTPFISSLEVLPWQNSRYDQTASSFLTLMSRSKLGMSEDNATYIRYPDDIYERSWFNRKMENSVTISASVAIDSNTSENTYKLPKEALSSAVQPVNGSSSLVINMGYNTSYDYYVYLHFFDFERKSQNEQRKMVITFSDGVNISFALEHLKPTTLVRNIKRGDFINNISIRSTSDSQLPAMLNAYEIYRVLPLTVNSITDEGDVAAIRDIKRVYDIKKISWQGDPCRPTDYTWEGLTCNNNGTPRITSINLRSSNLTGKIAPSFSNFTELLILDLSDNNLTGAIPISLAETKKLRDVNLTRNKIEGPIPQPLVDKENAGHLNFSADANIVGQDKPKPESKPKQKQKQKQGELSTGAKIGIAAGATGGVAAISLGLSLTLKFKFGIDVPKIFIKKGTERKSGKKQQEDGSKDKINKETSRVTVKPSIAESLVDRASEVIQGQIL